MTTSSAQNRVFLLRHSEREVSIAQNDWKPPNSDRPLVDGLQGKSAERYCQNGRRICRQTVALDLGSINGKQYEVFEFGQERRCLGFWQVSFGNVGLRIDIWGRNCGHSGVHFCC
jgi:hypothetical protein